MPFFADPKKPVMGGCTVVYFLVYIESKFLAFENNFNEEQKLTVMVTKDQSSWPTKATRKGQVLGRPQQVGEKCT